MKSHQYRFREGLKHCLLYLEKLRNLSVEAPQAQSPELVKSLMVSMAESLPQICVAQKFACMHAADHGELIEVVGFFAKIANASDSPLTQSKYFGAVVRRWIHDAAQVYRRINNQQEELEQLISFLEPTGVADSGIERKLFQEGFLRAASLANSIGTQKQVSRLTFYQSGALFFGGKISEAGILMERIDRGEATPEFANFHANVLKAQGAGFDVVSMKMMQAIRGHLAKNELAHAAHAMVSLAEIAVATGRIDDVEQVIELVIALKGDYSVLKFEFCCRVAEVLITIKHPEQEYFLERSVDYCKVFGFTDLEHRYNEQLKQFSREKAARFQAET